MTEANHMGKQLEDLRKIERLTRELAKGKDWWDGLSDENRRLQAERDCYKALVAEVLPQHEDQTLDWSGEWKDNAERAWVARAREALRGEEKASE